MLSGRRRLRTTSRKACLRKLQHAVGFDIPARYDQLKAFSQQAGFEDETAWLSRRLEYLKPEPAPQKHTAP